MYPVPFRRLEWRVFLAGNKLTVESPVLEDTLEGTLLMNFDSSLYISKFTSAERSQFWYYYHFVIQTFSLSHLKCGTSQGKCLLWEKSCSVCSTEVLLLRVRVSKCPWICSFRDGRACKTWHNPSTQHAGTYRWTAVWSESPWWLGGWVCSQWRCHWT